MMIINYESKLLIDSHLECLLHESTCSCEGAENENSWIMFRLASNKLLGNKIHPVSERSDETNTGISVECCQLVLGNTTKYVPE